MTDPGIIFQRTQAGRDEIHQKSHGLTQSERLVLIMVDGVSTYSQIRAKLPVLTDERFDRALQKLQLKELVLEVFMPLEDQAPDELERTVIDRFLQQDPMDPVTIMLRDPEEELGFIAPPARQVKDPEPVPVLMPELDETVVAAQAGSVAGVNASAVASPSIPQAAPLDPDPFPAEPAVDAFHAQMADSLAAEMRAMRALKPQLHRLEPVQSAVLPVMEVKPEPSPFTAVHWGYWLIVSGLSFILGFVLARITI